MSLMIQHNPVNVSLDVVWPGSSGKHDARMSEVSMDGCYIDSKVQGRAQVQMMLRMLISKAEGLWLALFGRQAWRR